MLLMRLAVQSAIECGVSLAVDRSLLVPEQDLARLRSLQFDLVGQRTGVDIIR